MPRVFIFRHGETEWSLNGRHTGRTDLPLTDNGKRRMREAAKALVGEDRLLTTSTLSQIFVSPRKRAHETLAILGLPTHIPVTETQALAEWDYGDYEGVTTNDIKASRPNGQWDIWVDGCPGGESPEDVTNRVDGLIEIIRGIHKDAVEENKYGDVVLVAHAHILRSFTARWLNVPVSAGRHFLLDAGGVGVLCYEHSSFDEPAVDCWNVTDGKGIGPIISRPTQLIC